MNLFRGDNRLLVAGANCRVAAALFVLTVASLIGLNSFVRVAAASAAPRDSLIKGPLPAVYYLADNGKRYVFPNGGVYRSWFSDFSGVITVSADELASYPLGGSVRYRPGVRLVKITTDPKVYVVDEGGALRWLMSESVARALYGSDWNRKIDDVPDAFFFNYTIGSPILAVEDFSPLAAAAEADTVNAAQGLAVGASPRFSDTTVDVGDAADFATGTPASAPRLPAVYFVSPAGDDANPGTAARPWRTIQQAADTLAAGDAVYIRAGTYEERVRPQNSGESGKLITYAAYPGEHPVIDGIQVELPADQAGLFEITDRSFIKVSGLKVINARTDRNSNGILVDRSADITIEKCSTYNTRSSGIGVWASRNVVVDGNEIELAGAGGDQESLSVAVTDNFEVKNNVLRGGGDKEGICLKDGSTNGQVYRNEVYGVSKVGIYVDAWDKTTGDIWIYQNIVHGTTDGDGIALASEMGGLLRNVYVHNNVVFSNRFIGLDVSRNGEKVVHQMRNIKVVNNTFYDNGGDWGGCISMDNPDAAEVVIRNNLCSQNRSFELSVSRDVPDPAVTVENNLIFSYKGDLADGEITGVATTGGDPFFVDAGAQDFRLRPDSPAIDRAAAVDAPKVDFDGRSRPAGAAVDIGAFEYPG